VCGVAFHPLGRLLASAADDCTVRIWDLETNVCIRVLDGLHTECMAAVGFHPTLSLLYTVSEDTTVGVYNSDSWAHIDTKRYKLQRGWSVGFKHNHLDRMGVQHTGSDSGDAVVAFGFDEGFIISSQHPHSSCLESDCQLSRKSHSKTSAPRPTTTYDKTLYVKRHYDIPDTADDDEAEMGHLLPATVSMDLMAPRISSTQNPLPGNRDNNNTSEVYLRYVGGSSHRQVDVDFTVETAHPPRRYIQSPWCRTASSTMAIFLVAALLLLLLIGYYLSKRAYVNNNQRH
jgi:WD40 repeat protein